MCRWSPCNIKSLSVCSHEEVASLVFLKCPEIKEPWHRVKASKKQQRSHHPLYQQLISPSHRASCSSFLTAYMPDNTFQTVAKGHMMLTDEFCNDSNSNNKINNINNNNNICPKGTYTQRACFFSISTKKSTE